MNNRSAIVLGTNAGQADLITYLKKKGWTVTSCAYQAGGPGEENSDKFELIDISDIDLVTRFARDQKADLVCSVSSDIAATTVVHVSSRLNLPHFFDVALIELFDSKPALRQHLNQHDLSPVAFIEAKTASDVAGWTAFPCMVKPADAQGQRGVVRIDHKDDLSTAIETAISLSRTATAIVEEFLDGVEISSNVLICNGKIVVNEFSERLVHSGKALGIPQGHLIPIVNVSQVHQQEADSLIHEVISSLRITDGTLYFQMIVTPAGPKIVEIAPRLDGCHIWRLIKAAHGIDFLDLSIRCLLGETIEVATPKPASSDVYELQFQQVSAGRTFTSDEFPVPSDNLYHEYRYNDGDDIVPINGRLEVVGYYVRAQTS